MKYTYIPEPLISVLHIFLLIFFLITTGWTHTRYVEIFPHVTGKKIKAVQFVCDDLIYKIQHYFLGTFM